ncbi:TetR/AcrR family transcriptional regulator [Marisediminicola sp. LYQ134]|uniref:TetR/AcrR family transcriptional regulator n=1 Tax=unclassified Marisediminicola TaxID=2618316 RepID=UPI003982DB6D
MARTRASLTAALHGLLAVERLDDITVSALCREANVHRTTFYGHFSDVGEFAASVFVRELDDIARVDIDPAADDAVETVRAAYAESLTNLLEHVAAERSAYRTLFASTIGARLRTALTERLRERALVAMTVWESKGVATTIDNAAASAYIAGGLVGSIEHWVVRDGATDDDAHDYSATVLQLMPAWWPRPA